MSAAADFLALQQARAAMEELNVREFDGTLSWGPPRDADWLDMEMTGRPWGEPPHIALPELERITVEEEMPEGKLTFDLMTRQPIEGLLKWHGDDEVNVDLHLRQRGVNGWDRGAVIPFPRTLAEACSEPVDTWPDYCEQMLRWFPELDREHRRALLHTSYIYHWFQVAEISDDLRDAWREFQLARSSCLLGSWFSPIPGVDLLLWLSAWAQEQIPAAFPGHPDCLVQSSWAPEIDDSADVAEGSRLAIDEPQSGA